jgi:hypothetical protein
VDGDGLADVLVGAYGANGGSYAGKAYLVLAASLGTASTIDLSLADHSFVGEHNGDKAGGSVSSAGDVDGDGLDDLLVGAPGHSTSHAYLILGASLGTTSTIDLSLADYNYRDPYYGAEAGESVSGAGDVNGDGLDDLLVGAPRSSSSDGTSPGKAYLILSGL